MPRKRKYDGEDWSQRLGDPAPPFVAWWWERFGAAVQQWPNEAVGAYMRLLAAQHQDGSIPADTRVLSKIAWCDSHSEFEHLWRTFIRCKFDVAPDDATRLVNVRAAKERAVASGRSGACRAGGALSSSGSLKTQTQTVPDTVPNSVPNSVPPAAESSPDPFPGWVDRAVWAAEVQAIHAQWVEEFPTLARVGKTYQPRAFAGLLRQALGERPIDPVEARQRIAVLVAGGLRNEALAQLRIAARAVAAKDKPRGYLAAAFRNTVEELTV